MMLPIETFTVGQSIQAPVGSLLMPFGDGDEVLRLRFDGQTKMAVRLDPRHQRAFRGYLIESSHFPVLAIEDWAIRVDPKSGYSAFNEHPNAGDIFILGDGTVGLIINLDYATRYVTVGGQLIDEPNFGEVRYIGFKAWSVGIEEDDGYTELLSVDRSKDD